MAESTSTVADVIGRLRAVYANHAGDPGFAGVLAMLRVLGPRFDEVWERQHIQAQRTRIRRLRRDGRVYAFRLVVLRLAEEPRYALVVHAPVDGDLSRP